VAAQAIFEACSDPMRRWAITWGLCTALCCSAHAQEPPGEAPDPTRLDVERLPPEAIEVKRDLFAQGLFVGAELGGRGFAGGVGRIAQPGVLARVLLGYELTQWLMLATAVELSLHATDAAAPPAPATFEVVDAVVQLRLQLPMSARAALFLGAEGGVGWVPGNLLEAYGLLDAGDLGLTYGGSFGFDWHLLSRHHSLGLLAGARLFPNLNGPDGEAAIGIHSLAYLKYVF
jgi:hypothetical protein